MQNNGNIEITSDQLTALATELSNGYLAYVKGERPAGSDGDGPALYRLSEHGGRPAAAEQRYHKIVTISTDCSPGISSALTNYMAGVMGSYSLLSPRFCRHRSLPRWNR